MIDNRISAVLPLEDFSVILGAVNQIKSKMPFLINLTRGDRRMLVKTGDRTRAFTTRALEVATQNPLILPQLFSLEEMRKDVELFQQLQQILLAMTQLQELIENTATLVESKAYTAALDVYGFAKRSRKVAALQEALGDLSKLFTRKTVSPAKPATPSTTGIPAGSATQSTSTK